MTTESVLHEKPRGSVRATDPLTSQWAAASIADATPSQERVLRVLRASYKKGLSQFTRQYVEVMTAHYMSPSRARTAVRELMDLGLIEKTGDYARLDSGRRAEVLRLTEKGIGE